MTMILVLTLMTFKWCIFGGCGDKKVGGLRGCCSNLVMGVRGGGEWQFFFSPKHGAAHLLSHLGILIETGR